MPIQNKYISSSNFTIDDWKNKRAYFKSECGNEISIHFCIFKDCFSGNENGGSILITQDCSVVIHSTQFIDSYTSMNRGGACCIVKAFKQNIDASIQDDQLQSLNVQYCCFSRCYPDSDNEKLYGLALFCASKETVVYYSSTVDCPPTDKNFISGGAQMDIQADHVKSKNVNITGGRVKFCAGIEYRFATKGHFKFQAITNIKECMLATTFTSISIANLELSFSNYDNNKLFNKAEEKDIHLLPALIHIREKDIVISNFCFTNFIDDSGKAKIVSRGTYYINENNVETNHEQKLKITFINCYRDSTINDEKVGVKYIDGQEMLFGEVAQAENLKTNMISQLLLGHCEGQFKPGDDIVIEDANEPTDIFTKSGEFSKSLAFTETNKFSKSLAFIKTSKFSKSLAFIETNKFSKSLAFIETNKFSKSLAFIETSKFSKSLVFTEIDCFSETADFSISTVFTRSNKFANSGYFTHSSEFSKTDGFTKTGEFSKTTEFTKTGLFSKSTAFSQSDDFLPTVDFNHTNSFTPSKKFTPSNKFSKSDQFSKSDAFSKTEAFSYTQDFTKSAQFSASSYFSDSQKFSTSSPFTKTGVFFRHRKIHKNN